MSDYRHKGSIHVFGKDPSGGGGGKVVGWIIGIAVVLVLLAAA